MFKAREDENYSEQAGGGEDTVIGSSIKIEGDLVSNGSIVVEGEVVGNLKTERNLRVGEKAKITADVKAQEAFIAGKIQGNIEVQGKLEMTSTAEVLGDVKAGVVSIAAGANFNGRCTMSGNTVKKVEESN